MAVNTEVVIYPGKRTESKEFALLMEKITTQASGILYGCAVSLQNGVTIDVTAGWCVIRGRLIRVDAGSMTVELPQSGTVTYNLVLKIELSNTANPTTTYFTTETPSDSSDFNMSDGNAYLILGTVTASTTEIIEVTSSTLMPDASSLIGSIDALNTTVAAHTTKLGDLPGKIWISTATPSTQGNNGDLWFTVQ